MSFITLGFYSRSLRGVLARLFLKHFFICNDVLIKRPIKWRQHPDMTMAVDWYVKHQFEETKDLPVK